jgi:predicted amidophosphoribosyltransferase
LYEQYVSALADLSFPQHCVGCDRRASDLLWRDCFEALLRVGRPACARCGTPTIFETFFCGACKDLDFDFESARAAAVRRRRRRDRARPEVPRLREGRREAGHAAHARGARPRRALDAVVPVPLHRSRLRRCGFNQAELLARGVAAGLDAPVFDTLKAVRRTRDQVELTAAERRANVEGAYAIRGRVRGRVLLVDHVFTTGATMSSCAETLLRGGAQEVHAVSLCRTQGELGSWSALQLFSSPPPGSYLASAQAPSSGALRQTVGAPTGSD